MQRRPPATAPSPLPPSRTAGAGSRQGASPATALLVVLVVALAALAWHLRFLQDDAFISFRYAANLAHGHGLVWNPGEQIEGYTNFLWTLLLGGAVALGLDPAPTSLVLGIACFVLTLLATFRLARFVLGSAWPALGVVALLGTNYSFAAYATGGLETQLQACLLTWAAHLALSAAFEDRARPSRLAGLSLVCGLALLTRLDSALFVAVLGVLVVVALYRPAWLARPHAVSSAGAGVARPGRGALVWLFLPALLLVGPWLAWKWGYYGDLLPNPFHVKVGSGTSLVRGLYYVALFCVSYLFAHVPVLVLAAFARRPAALREPAGALLGLALAWTLYVVGVGGDFMEFRFLVPMLPVGFVLAGWLFFARVRPVWLRVALALAVVGGSAHHALTFGRVQHGVESVELLQAHITSEHWSQAGERLAETFPAGPDDVTIATTAAGVIPYYSGLRTVDMLGLNDRWIARHGEVVGTRPGHRRWAPLGYLLRRRVNLVIGHPWVVLRAFRPSFESLEELVRNSVPFEGPLPEAARAARLVELPLDRRTKLLMLYLVPSPRVEQALQRGALTVVPLGGAPASP